MIPLFRRIRKKLAEDNKPKKYLRYAIGEIVLVVIGILIALQINNWNEKLQTEQHLKYKLELLINSIKNDRIELINLKECMRFKIYSLQHLLKLSGKQPVSFEHYKTDGFYILPYKENPRYWKGAFPENVDKDFIDKTFLESARITGGINPNAFEELKFSGTFSLIKNDSLNKTLNNYYGTFQAELNQKYINVLDSWRKEFIYQGAVFYNTGTLEEPLMLITDEPRFEASMKEVIYESLWIGHVIELGLNYIDDFLIKEIGNEISNLE